MSPGGTTRSRAARRICAISAALVVAIGLGACGEKEEPDLSTVPIETTAPTTPTVP